MSTLTGKNKSEGATPVDSTTGMVGKVISGSGAGALTTEYRYDGNGNITQHPDWEIPTGMIYDVTQTE
jgi:hypothetical protein